LSGRYPRGALAWVALAALLLAGAWLGTRAPVALLEWRPTLAWPEVWRWWTPAWVHYSPGHLLANSAGALVLALLGWRAALPCPAALAWLLAWPLTHLGLALRPELLHYGGLSGVLHAGVAVAGWQLALAGDRWQRRVGIGLLAGLTVKLLLEAPWGTTVRHVPGWDVPIAPWAHFSGALAGSLAAAIVAAGAAVSTRR